MNSVEQKFQEGPPLDPCPGEGYTVQLVNALMQSPVWKETAIIITYDDWGGLYDHVAPKFDRCADGSFFCSRKKSF